MRKFTEEQEADICVQYKKGRSTRLLGVHYGCCHKTIATILERASIERRKKLTVEERARISRAGQNQVREKSHHWKGGMRIKEGRRVIRKPEHPYVRMDGEVPNSRLVMEKKLGRFLLPGEQVHHINGDTLDDRPENLMLFPNGNAHRRHHIKRGDHPRNEAGRFCRPPDNPDPVTGE